MKSLVLVLSLFLFAACSQKLPIDVQGHRGARAIYPENTFPAFQHALEAGASTLELDLHMTADEVLVVTHDPYINPEICLDPKGRTIDEKIPVIELSLKQLQGFDCGSLKNPRFPLQRWVGSQKIPSLRELLDFLENSYLSRARRVRLNIETKIRRSQPKLYPSPQLYAELLYEIIDEYNLDKRVTVQSFDERTLQEIREIDSEIETAFLVGRRPASWDKLLSEFYPDIISPNYRWLKKEDVQVLQQKGLRVVPWTVNKPADWKRMMTYGVDGIITDNPEALVRFLRNGST